jgi:hypothetical protein
VALLLHELCVLDILACKLKDAAKKILNVVLLVRHLPDQKYGELHLKCS